jgi:G3E family GTPase
MIPVSLVTGFLGSGKTTLIAALLRDPALAGTLVIVNEFGEVGIDHDLLEASSDDTILLANGCLCCTIRGNLVDTLLDVQAQRAEGRLRDFDRIVVETSGVVDPGPVLAFLFGDARIAALHEPGAVVTTVDALAGADLLGRHPEALSQVVLADRLLITKPDLASPESVEAIATRLRQLNPQASIMTSIQGGGVTAAILALPGGTHPHHACSSGCADHLHHHHAHGHQARFDARLLQARRPLRLDEVRALADAIRAVLTPGVLRLKGMVTLADAAGCAVIQATPGQVHAPRRLTGATSSPGTLVLITEGDAPAPLLAALAACEIHPAAHKVLA